MIGLGFGMAQCAARDPGPAAAANAPLRFVSDVQLSRTDPYPEAATAAIAAAIGGGVVYDAGDVSEHAWPDEYDTYLALYPQAIAVPGNHDWYAPGLEGWPWSTGVDVIDGGIHLVGSDAGIRTNQAAMAALELSLAPAGRPTVLFLHHPLFSANARVGAAAATIRAAFLPVVEAAAVDLVIGGHGHAYERHEYGGRTFLVIGTGGAHLDTVGTAATLVTTVSVHGWLEVQATAAGLACTFKAADGSTVDAFTVQTAA
jgi:3',5'-cyclic AMP phosphodiesterase CpdA